MRIKPRSDYRARKVISSELQRMVDTIAFIGQYGLGEFSEMNTSRSDEHKQKKTEVKKDYQPPEIVYREALEVSASVCSPGKTMDPCVPHQS